MRFVVLACLTVSLAGAASINYNDFGGDTSNLQLNGVASIQGSALQLVPNVDSVAGTAYEKTAVSFSGDTWFSTSFKFNISTDPGNVTDGFAFVLQNDIVSALGDGGRGNGFTGIQPSLAVIFRDRGPAFIGAVVNGEDTLNNDPAGPVDATAFDPEGTFYNEDEYAWIDYNPYTAILSVSLSETNTKPGTPVMSTSVNAAAILGSQAWVGFSAGNGAGTGTQDILSWSFESGVPEPGTFGLYTLGLGIAAWARKRFQAR
jgi:hypothetical protein